MSPLQLQVIPDEWTGQPPFVPGEHSWESLAMAVMHTRAYKIPIPMQELQELTVQLKRMMLLGLIDHDGNAIPARPLVRTEPALDGEAAQLVQLADGSVYQFAPGGIVAQ